VIRGWFAAGIAALGTLGAVLAAGAALCMTAGCSNLSYYAQSAGGHLAIVRAAKPVSQWLADADTSAALRSRLVLSQNIRDFAVRELAEPDNASYRRYADLGRTAAVWNVVATAQLSMELKTWCFLVVGCVGYRGYYDQAQAERYAQALRSQGLEVYVYGVPAYSTLGKLPSDVFADPLLNTFINYPEGELARLIFHELAHQVAYAPGDTLFNESFATSVERIGAQRWLTQRASAQAREDYRASDARREDFRELTQRYRGLLDAVYRSADADADKLRQKAAVMQQLRSDYEILKRDRWGGFSGYDAWFAHANNASFGVLGAYSDLVPNFGRLFARLDGDFPRFYTEVRRLAALDLGERRRELP
jgi:predicted aminopeptidase